MDEGRRRVACLQRMLDAAAGVDPRLPRVEVTGVFDEGTLEALMTFQRDYCPPVTGRPDAETWRALEAVYHRVERERARAVFQSGMPADLDEVRPGQEAACLDEIKFMFRRLRGVLDGLEEDEDGPRYGPATERNVRALQAAAGMEEDGVICPRLWEMLARLYDLCVVRLPEAAAAGPEPTE